MPEPEEVKIVPPEGFMYLAEEPACSALSTEQARKYLWKRGIRKDIVRDAELGITFEGKQKGRVIVPIKDPGGLWLGWVGRIYHSRPVMLKYVYPTGMKRDMFFNQKALYAETDEPLYVMEGVFDALPHFPHAIACLGKPAKKQVEILLATERPVVVALDGDAWQEGEALAMRLKLEGKRAGFIKFPPLTDPGDVFQDELFELGTAALA
jgi:DNA primase